MGQFDKFTERARKVLELAQEESRRFNHDYIGTEHLLLGLVREGDGVAARVLNNMGVQFPKIRSAVEFIIGRGEGEPGLDVRLSPRCRKVLELAVDESRKLEHHYIGTEHLLLGLVREGEGIAAGVLESLGVNLEKVRSQVMQVVSGSAISRRSYSFPPRVDHLHTRMFAVLAHAARAAEKENAMIGTGHLLIGLLAEGGTAASILGRHSVNSEAVEALPEAQRQPIQTSSGGLSSAALVALNWAGFEVRDPVKSPITPEHVLLQLTEVGDAAAILAKLGVDLEALRRDVLSYLVPDTEEPEENELSSDE
jgi:ATP-dependent Clp protease ATP-binding subunit ClpA